MSTETKPSLLDQVFGATSTEESRRLYDEWAATYDSDMAGWDFTAPQLVAEGVARGLKLSNSSDALKGLRILDAGCGTGLVGVELAKLGADRIHGLDLSEGMLKVANKTGAYADLATADLTKKLAFEDGAFDAVTCCGTFTHGHLGPEPMADFVRVVKKGGVVVATVLETHWEGMGFAAEAERLAKSGICEIVEKDVHQYRKQKGGGIILILRKI